MANFGANVTEVAPIQSHDTVKEGIVNEPVALQGLANIFDTVGGVLDARKASQQEKFVAEFTNNQLAIIQALDQGVPGYNSRFARTKLRTNLISAIESHPGLREELLKTNLSILGKAGMGDIVTDGTAEEIRTNKLIDAAVESGYVSPNASEGELQSAAAEMQRLARVEESYRLRAMEIDAKLKDLSLTQKQREELEQQKKINSEQFVIDVSPSTMDQFTNISNALISNPDLSQAEKLQQLEEYWISLTQEFSSYMSGISNSTKGDALMKTFEQRKALTEQLIKGELRQDEHDRNIEAITSRLKSGMLNDDRVARAVVTSELFGHNMHPSVQMDVQRVVADIYNQQLEEDETAANLFGKNDKALKTYLKEISTVDETSNAAVDEQRVHLQRILEGAEDYGNSLARNPEHGITLVDWMASPEFLKATKTHPDLFQNTDALQTVLKEHYYSEVLGLIKREFTEKNVKIFGDVTGEPMFGMMGGATGRTEGQRFEMTESPVPEMFQAVITPNGVSFELAEGVEMSPEVSATFRKLNKEVKPIINNVIKSSAHLEGRTDYSTIAQETFQRMFGDISSGEDEGDDLELADFSLGGDILDEALTTGGFVGDGNYEDAETPADVAASFIGFREKEEKSVLSSFIKETTGDTINPANTAWCAAFVNAALGAKGSTGTGSLAAKSFLNWGESVTTPKKGDIVVFDRGNQAWQGHVGFYAGRDSRGNILVLGGNQDNTVSIKPMNPSKLLGYRRGKVTN